MAPHSPISIAIDGPAGAGKSTVARMVARQLGYTYLDTGAMYRAITLAVLRNNIAAKDEAKISQLIKDCQLDIKPHNDGTNHIYLNGEDVSSKIRQLEVSNAVSDVANHKCVRKKLVEQQRQMSARGGTVLDGRDIGTVVLPKAELKIFLTASLAVRAKRRLAELEQSKTTISMEELARDIALRDEKDANNLYGPMIPAEDAIHIDTDNMTIEQVVDDILQLAQEKVKAYS